MSFCFAEATKVLWENQWTITKYENSSGAKNEDSYEFASYSSADAIRKVFKINEHVDLKFFTNGNKETSTIKNDKLISSLVVFTN